MNITWVGAAAFILIVKKQNIMIFIVLLKELDDFFNKDKQHKVRLTYITVKLLNKNINPATILDPDYHKLLLLLLRQEVSKLLLYRPYNVMWWLHITCTINKVNMGITEVYVELVRL